MAYGAICGLGFAGTYFALGATKLSQIFTNDAAVITKVGRQRNAEEQSSVASLLSQLCLFLGCHWLVHCDDW